MAVYVRFYVSVGVVVYQGALCMRGRLKGRLRGSFGRRRLPIKRAVVLLLAVAVAFALATADARLKPIVEKVAAQQVHLAVVRLINEAVYDQLGSGVAYQQLVNVSRDESGRVTLMQPDTVKITRLVTSIARDVENRLSGLSRRDVNIPLGLLTGSLLLADKGPNLVVGLVPVGSVSVDVRDEFTSAGINQTKHSIMLDIVVKVGILLPMQTSFAEICDSLPIVESVIVGPIPETYLNFRD